MQKGADKQKLTKLGFIPKIKGTTNVIQCNTDNSISADIVEYQKIITLDDTPRCHCVT